MANEQSISAILSLASICEYVAVVKGGAANALQGGSINQNLARLIYMERLGIQNRYNLNPSDPTLQGTANYLFSILTHQRQEQTIKNNVGSGLPVLTGPSNQSGIVGFTATFSVSVVSATPVTYVWFQN